MDKPGIEKSYKLNFHVYESLAEEGKYILKEMTVKENIKTHNITSRIKELDSVFDKCERKEYSDPLKEVTDIVGIRVVCLFRADIARVGEIIRKEFDVLSEDNKIDGSDVSSFGYMSFHYLVRIKQDYQGVRYDHIKNQVFEIQVRTIAMDAWATISHYLDYKTDSDVPTELRKDFYALSGLFYVADTHFKYFYDSSKSSRRNIDATLAKGTLGDIELNADSLSSFLVKTFPDRKHADAKSVSELVTDLTDFGYTTLSSVEDLVKRAEEKFKAREKTARITNAIRFSDVGVVRVSLRVLNPKYETYITGRAVKRAKRRSRKLRSLKD